MFHHDCISCHNRNKAKGELVMETEDLLLKGGKNGQLWDSAAADLGLLMQRVHLPIEKKHHMPPKGKTPLTDDEAAVLAWWIEAGLPKDGTLRARKAPTEVRVAFSRTLPEGERRTVEELQNRQAAEYEATLTGLRASIPGSLRAILPGERDLEYTAAIAGAAFTDAELQKLEPVGNDLLWLDLSRTGVTDAGLKVLAKMPNLERVDLRGTSVGDDGVKAIAGLHHLETLSLYGTRVTDAGLEALRGTSSLKRLYVGGTKVSAPAVEALRKTRKELQVTP
jgi:hypothetical protein